MQSAQDSPIQVESRTTRKPAHCHRSVSVERHQQKLVPDARLAWKRHGNSAQTGPAATKIYRCGSRVAAWTERTDGARAPGAARISPLLATPAVPALPICWFFSFNRRDATWRPPEVMWPASCWTIALYQGTASAVPQAGL